MMRVDRFVGESEDFAVVQCGRCMHNLGGGKCSAFPNGIPREILSNKVDHRKPYPGDNGIRFELKAGSASPYPDPDES